MDSPYSLKNVALRRQIAGSIVGPILTGKKDRTVMKVYDRIAPGSDGRIHTQLAPRTASGRLASFESGVDEASTNLQNIVKKVGRADVLYRARDVFIPKEGMVLLANDYKNAEGILAGAYSKDWGFVDKILAGEDVHEEHARYFFEVDEPTDLQRDVAKTIYYAGLYYATAETLTRTLNKDADLFGRAFHVVEVADLRARNLQMHPLEVWWQEVDEELERNGGWLRNCFGYRRVFYDPDNHNRLKDGLSFYPQSTVSSLMNRALPRIFTEVDVPDEVELILQVHDEVIHQCLPERVEETDAQVRAIMTEPFTIHGRELYLPVDGKVGERWGQMQKIKEWKNAA